MRFAKAVAQADAAASKGGWAEAESLLRMVAEGGRENLPVLVKLGVVQFLQGKLDEAKKTLGQAVVHEEAGFDAWYNFGCVLQKMRDMQGARDCFRHALQFNAKSLDAKTNLAVVAFELGDTEEAIALSYAALTDHPRDALTFANLSNFLRAQGANDEAWLCAQASVGIDPANPVALKMLGTLEYDRRRYGKAIEYFLQALKRDPENASLHLNVGMAALAQGDFANGWREYEWRHATMPYPGAPASFALPLWRGEDIRGKTLLLFAEQGHGDTLQFIRLAQDVVARGARVRAVVQPALVRLLQRCPYLDEVVDEQAPLPSADYHLPLMGLPFALGLAQEATLPVSPYVFPVAEDMAEWKRRLTGEERMKIGLVWAGEARPHDPELNRMDGRRSLSLEAFAPLFCEEGQYAWFSLQKGVAASQANAWPQLIDYSDEWQDFSDTAAFVANLDLVISVDTAVAHLAAAMGRPTWLLSRADPCWRWLGNRETNPWYPSLRVFGQTSPGDWGGVIGEVAKSLSLCSIPDCARAT